MDEKLEINRLQQKLYLAYHQDGILDLVIGLCAIGFSVFMATGTVAMLILSWLPVLAYLPLKQAVTRPRFGYVRFTPENVTRARLTASVVIGLLVLGVFLVFIIGTRSNLLPDGFMEWMSKYHLAVLGGFAGLAAAAAALYTGLKRLYLYGLLAFLLPAAGAWIGLETYVPILALGLLIFCVGLFLLARFVQSHPLNEEG